MLTCIRQVDLPHQYYILCLITTKRASTVRVKRSPSVRNERRTRRRIHDEEMGLREASASHGQDEQAAEDGRKSQQVVGKIHMLQKMLEKLQQVMDKINRV